MEKREFAMWGKWKKGWDDEEVEDEWNKMKDDLSVARDNLGKDGALRLAVDKGGQEVGAGMRAHAQLWLRIAFSETLKIVEFDHHLFPQVRQFYDQGWGSGYDSEVPLHVLGASLAIV